MTGSTIELFSTSILSNVKVRTRHERFTSVLAIKKIPYVYHDLASDDDAKSRWRRKAKDPQLPGILVNNEWVGSYDEFEEAVEFGELELFLGVSPAQYNPLSTAPHPAQSAISSKDPSLYPTLPYAAEGAGKWKEPDADQFISSLNIKEEEIDDTDVDALLADIGKLPAQPSASTIPEKKYVPSKEAAIKPLRLAKMGPTTSHQRMPSGSPSRSPSTGASAGSRASPIARYSATQRSTKALAAEAAALTSDRKTSGALLREAVSQGKNLDDAMEQSRMKHIVGQDNLDDLFASLGLSDVDIGDDEVDRFLEQGAIPQGLRLGGDRVHKPSSIADKARDEAVARDLVQKAKERGHGSARSSLSQDLGKLVGLEPASQIRTKVDEAVADTSSTSGRTSALSTQTSTVSEASSAVPETKTDEISTVEQSEVQPLPSKDDKTALSALKSASEPVEAVNEQDAEAAASTGDKVIALEEPKEKSGASKAEDAEPVAASLEQKVTTTDTEASKPAVKSSDTIETELPTSASRKSVTAAATSESTSQQAPSASIGSIVVGKVESDVKTAPAEEEEKGSLPAIPASDSRRSLADESVADAKKEVEPTISTSASKDALESAKSTTPAIVEAAKSETTKSHLSTSTSEGDGKNAGLTDIDNDRTPTKEVTEDPIQANTASKPEEDGEDVKNELAQAALIASRFEDHKNDTAKDAQSSLSFPATTGDEDKLASSGSVPASLNAAAAAAAASPATSPTRAKTAAAATATATSPVGTPAREQSLGVGAAPAKDISRQASSSSNSGAISSSRRAIDVARPIDPALSPPPPQSATSDYFSTSPDTKKKRGIRGFGLGRDKEKNAEKGESPNEKETGKSKSPDTATGKSSSPAATAGPSRHERTISQILREADAVLGMDDYGDGSDDDGSEDPAMFGTSSVDIDAGPNVAVRSSSKLF